MTEKPKIIIEMGPDDVEEIVRQFEAENPGKNARVMTSKEFADRFMDRLYASAKRVQ